MNKLTVAMIVLSLAFGGFAYLEFQGSKEDEVRKANEAQLVGWGEDQLKSASLKKGTKLMRVEKRDGDWYLTDPLQDFADQFNVNSWTGDIATEKAAKLEGVKTQADGSVFWSEYGLDKDVTVVEIEKDDGTKATIQFAKNNAFDGSFYIRYNGSVYLGVKPWAGVLAKKVDGLRSKDVFRKKSALEKIKVLVDGEELSLISKGDEKWEVEGDPDFPFADSSLKAFTRQLSGLRIQSFVDDSKDLKNKKKYGLNQPLGVVTGTMGGKELTITIGRPVSGKKDQDDKYYAMVSDSKSFYELHPAAAKSLIKKKIDFKDRTIPFQFDLTEAAGVRLVTKANTLELIKDGSTWKLAKPQANKVLKSSELETFLSGLKAMAAKDYLKKPRSGRFDGQLVIEASDGSELFNFAWTKNKSDDSVFYGKSNLTDLGFTVMASKVNEWTVDRFLEDPNAKEEKATN